MKRQITKKCLEEAGILTFKQKVYWVLKRQILKTDYDFFERMVSSSHNSS